ncbi:MAG: xanthine dehydrogenase family protein subunit M [Hyphomicrobiales bacterium]|nr:xanthine dehydrogenase family protein subunit M [Hyphomicrobiales bacterium]
MKAPEFDYARPASLDEALRLLADGGEDARVIAGGQSLVPALNLRLAAPPVVVDIGGLDPLRGIEAVGDGLRIGALVRHAELARSALVAARCPLLTQAIAHVAHPAIRNRGTFGGSLAQADPAAELPACALALDAIMIVASRSGERRVAAQDFFRGVYETALAAGEILVAVEIPALGADRRFGFAEFSRRRGDFAIVGVAAAATKSGGRLASPRIAFFGTGDRPQLARAAAAALDGAANDTNTRKAAREKLAADLDPVEDSTASRAMRLHLAGEALEQAIDALWREAA